MPQGFVCDMLLLGGLHFYCGGVGLAPTPLLGSQVACRRTCTPQVAGHSQYTVERMRGRDRLYSFARMGKPVHGLPLLRCTFGVATVALLGVRLMREGVDALCVALALCRVPSHDWILWDVIKYEVLLLRRRVRR